MLSINPGFITTCTSVKNMPLNRLINNDKLKYKTHSLKPKPNVELFMRRTKLSVLNSWNVRRLAIIINWAINLSVCLKRIEILNIVFRTNYLTNIKNLYDNVRLMKRSTFGLSPKCLKWMENWFGIKGNKIYLFLAIIESVSVWFIHSDKALNGRKKANRLIIHQYALLGLRAMETYNWLVQVQWRYL